MQSHRVRIVATLVALCASLAATNVLAAQDSGIPVGTKAPPFSIENLAGQSVDITQYLGKTPVLLEFWATWCENCQALEPSFLAVEKKYESRVKFIGVAVSYNESVTRVKLYSEKHGFRHEILYDRKGDAGVAYDVPATSYVVVIDKAGKVVYTGLGGDQNLEKAIAKAGVN